MYSPAFPKLDKWYRLPDAEIFRVTCIAEDQLQIQYPDGAHETVEMAIWQKLGAMEIEHDKEWLDQQKSHNEPDLLSLGVATGSEGLEYIDYFNLNTR